MICPNCEAVVVVSPSDTDAVVTCGICHAIVREGSDDPVRGLGDSSADLMRLPPHVRAQSISTDEILLPASAAVAALEEFGDESVRIASCDWYVGTADAFRSWSAQPSLRGDFSSEFIREAVRNALAVFGQSQSATGETLFVAIALH